jgi:hypothetical protein
MRKSSSHGLALHMGGRALNPQKPGKPNWEDTAKATGHPVGTVSNFSDETSDRSAATSDKETDERVERLGGCKNPHVSNAADAAASEPRAFNGVASSQFTRTLI